MRVSRKGQTRFTLAFAGFANFYLAGLYVMENLDPHRSKWLHATTPDSSSRATGRNGLLSAPTESLESNRVIEVRRRRFGCPRS